MEIKFNIDDKLNEHFKSLLQITGDDMSTILQDAVKDYVTKACNDIMMQYAGHANYEANDSYYCKALTRIPTWAVKSHQYNHKIIKAFFIAEEKYGNVTLDVMEKLCSNKNSQELYVPTFKNNYSQMKVDNAHSHGKVFEDNGVDVWLWAPVAKELIKYKDCFFNSVN